MLESDSGATRGMAVKSRFWYFPQLEEEEEACSVGMMKTIPCPGGSDGVPTERRSLIQACCSRLQPALILSICLAQQVQLGLTVMRTLGRVCGGSPRGLPGKCVQLVHLDDPKRFRDLGRGGARWMMSGRSRWRAEVNKEQRRSRREESRKKTDQAAGAAVLKEPSSYGVQEILRGTP
jgi:hypothetical protein